MRIEKALIVLSTAILILFALWFVRHLPSTYRAEGQATAGPIIEKRYKIVLQNSKLDHRQENFSSENIKAYFSDNIIDAHTYNFLRYLDDLVSDIGADEDALEKIQQYLESHLPADQAARMYDLYALYLDYQMNWQEHLKYRGMALSPEEALENLISLQEYRRAVFGDENADMIFGAGVEAQEYTIRRNMILYDNTLYGAEKEALLSALNDEMWGDELASQNPNTAYDHYQETLRLYQKDLAELRTDEERTAFLEQIRLTNFDPVQRQALEAVETTIEDEKLIKQDYYAEEKEILNDLYLTEPERAEKIRTLQDATFGQDAEAFRRREAMRKEMEQRINNQNSEDASTGVQ